MKHLYLLFSLCCMVAGPIYAQPKVPLEFKSLQPKWQHYSYDPNLPRFLQLYEQVGKPLIIDKDAYLLHSIFNNEHEGYLVENIDLETGQTKWRDSYYATKLNTKRYPAPLTQKGDKIEMYYFQEWAKVKPISFWQDARFRRIDYCADTGKKCDSLITDVKDSLNATLTIPFLLYDPFTRYSHIFTYHNKVQYLRYRQIYNDSTKQSYLPFKMLLLDSLGHIVDSSNTTIYMKYAISNVKLEKYQEGKYVCLIHAQKYRTEKSPKEVKLIYFDEHFKVEKTIDISTIRPKAVFTNIKYVDANNILLYAVTDISKNGLLHYKISGILLKSSGELVESVDFDNYELSDENGDSFALTYLPKTKQVVLINTIAKIATKTYNMEILATDGKGKFDLLKTVTLNDTGDMGIYDLTTIGDSSLLCRFKYLDIGCTKSV